MRAGEAGGRSERGGVGRIHRNLFRPFAGLVESIVSFTLGLRQGY